MWDAYFGETHIKRTRKERVCFECQRMIVAGSPAVDWCGVWDGEFAQESAHSDCGKAARRMFEALDMCEGDEGNGLREESNREPDMEALIRLECKEWPAVIDRLFGDRKEGERHDD